VTRREIAHILTITDGDDWTVTCPYEGQCATGGRPCGTYQWGSDGGSVPTALCWVAVCDESRDEVTRLRRIHGPGTFVILVSGGLWETEIGLGVLARIAPTAGEGQR
jgi:hypothetical protein